MCAVGGNDGGVFWNLINVMCAVFRIISMKEI
jgi:hypothetical protein